MADLLDIFGGGGDSAPSGGLLSPDGTIDPAAYASARRNQAMLGLAAGLLSQGPSRLPVGFGQSVGQGLQGMLGAQNSFDTSALNQGKVGLLNLQAQELKGKVGLLKAASEPPPPMFGGSAASPGPAGAASTADTIIPPAAGGGPGSLSIGDMKAAALRAGFQGDAADTMAATAMAESGGNPFAANEKGEHSYGITQINADAHGPKALGAYGDPDKAMQLAYDISKGGTDFTPWTMFKNGQYKNYLGAAKGASASPGTLASVPDFAGMMAGNQGPSDAPAADAGSDAPGPAARPLNPSLPVKTNAIGEQYQFDPDTGWHLVGNALPLPQAIQAARALRPGSPGYAATRGPGNDVGVNIDPSSGPMTSPPPSGLLAQNSPQGAPPPAGGLISPPPSQAVPAVTQPQAPAVAPAMVPGGAGQQINPDYVRWAQQQAAIRSALGVPVPAHIAEAAKLPLVGPSAAATASGTAAGQLPYAGPLAAAKADAENASKLRYAGPIAGSEARAKLPYTFGRPGGALPEVDASGNPTGRFTTVPALGERTNPADGSQGPAFTQLTPQGPVTTPVPGITKLGPGQTKTLENSAAVQPLTLQNPVSQTGPGYTAPLKSEAGTIIPPASAATPIRGSKDYLDDRSKEFSKVESEWGNSTQSAAEAQQRMTAIMSALKQYQSGAFASHLSEIRAGLKSAGISLPESVAGNPAQAEIILKNNFGAAIQTMKATGLSRWTQAELFSSQKNMANPDLQPEANLAIGAQTIGTLQWEQQMQRDFAQAKKYGGFLDPQDFQRQWAQSNPLQPFVDRAEQQLGPLKGMPGGAGPRRGVFDPRTGTINWAQ